MKQTVELLFFFVNKQNQSKVYVLKFIEHPLKTGQLLFFLIYIARVTYNIAIYVLYM